MEPSNVIDDDAEFWLPPEFLTDEDFLLEKENNENRRGLSFTVKSTRDDDDDDFLTGLTKQMVKSTLEDKAWGMNRSQSTVCVAGIGCCCCNRGLLPSPTKLSPVSLTANAAAKIPDNASGYYNHHQSLQYQKLQALQYERLKQLQLMKHNRQLVQQQSRGGIKSGGQVDLSSYAWTNQLPRRDFGGSRMRAVFLGDNVGKRGSTGTGVFLPQHNITADTRKKPTITTVLVPARVAQVLSENDVWKQRSNNGGFMGQMIVEQAVNEPSLPLDWDY